MTPNISTTNIELDQIALFINPQYFGRNLLPMMDELKSIPTQSVPGTGDKEDKKDDGMTMEEKKEAERLR